MFDIGFWELVLIFGMGLMFLGPERLPRIANQVGRWVGKARRTASQLRRQLERELDLNDLTNSNTYSRPKPPPPPSSVAAEPAATDHAPPDHALFDEETSFEDGDAAASEPAATDHAPPDHAVFDEETSLEDGDAAANDDAGPRPEEQSREPTANQSSTGSK